MTASILLITALLAQEGPSVFPPPPPNPSTTEATTQPTFEQLRAEHKKLVDDEFSLLPNKPAMPIQKIVSVTLDGGYLHVRPLLPITNGAVAQPASDWPGMLQLVVGIGRSANDAANLPEDAFVGMSLKHVDLSKPDQIATYTHVITGPDYLQLNRDSESDHGQCSVTLIQSRQFADENDDPIRLTVRAMSDDGRTPEVNIQIAGESFIALRRDHPQVMQKYLLPILADLQCAAILRTSDPATAWQVLATEVKIDQATKDRVVSLLHQLKSTEFSERAMAEEQLAAMGAVGAAVLSRIDTSDLPADPKATVETIVRSHSPLPEARVAELRKDLGFLCDTLLLDDPALRAAAASRIGDLTGKAVDLPATLTAADREKRVAALRAELVPATQPDSKK